MANGVSSFLESTLQDDVNRNIKSITQRPDGTVNVSLFEGTQSPSGITRQITPPLSAAQRQVMRFGGVEPQEVGQVSRAQIPGRVPEQQLSSMKLQETDPLIRALESKPIPTIQAGEGSGINEILGNPAVISALAHFGKAFAKNQPGEPGTILGNAALGMAEKAQQEKKSQVFSQFVSSLQDSTIDRPPESELALLAPEEIVAAQSLALRQQQDARQSRVAAAQAGLAEAQTQRLEGLPSFEEELQGRAMIEILGRRPQTVRPESANIKVKQLPDGMSAPEGKLFVMQLNPRTGLFDINAGLVPDPSVDKGTPDRDLRPNASLRNQMRQATAEIMKDVIKAGISRELKTNNLEKINRIYTAFKDQATGAIDITRIRSFLTNEESLQFARLLNRFENNFIKGEPISDTELRVLSDVVARGQTGEIGRGDQQQLPSGQKPKPQFIQ